MTCPHCGHEIPVALVELQQLQERLDRLRQELARERGRQPEMEMILQIEIAEAEAQLKALA